MPGKQDGPSRIIYGPPRPPRIAQNAHFFTLGPIYVKLVIIFFPCYKFVCSVMRSYCPEIFVHLGSTQGPPRTPQIWKKLIILSYFGFKLKNVLSDCFLISHVHRYGWEDSWNFFLTFWPINEKMVFKLFPLVVHMSTLWWGLSLLTFWCPWYPWILCKGSTWPPKKLN